VTVVLVGLAGMLGVLARYGISSAFHGDALPWATVAINVAGSFALGLLVVSHHTSQELRTVLGVGFLGGFTTSRDERWSTWRPRSCSASERRRLATTWAASCCERP